MDKQKEFNLRVHIGLKLNNLRTECHVTKTQLGVELGVVRQQIQKYENGTARMADYQLYRLTKLFNVDMNYFFYGYEDNINTQAFNKELNQENKEVNKLNKLNTELESKIEALKQVNKEFMKTIQINKELNKENKENKESNLANKSITQMSYTEALQQKKQVMNRDKSYYLKECKK